MKKQNDIASGTEPTEQPLDGNRKIQPLVRCDRCRFSIMFEGEEKRNDKHIDDRRFECRRFPPSILVAGYGEDDVESSELNFAYPTVTGEKWCGEFSPNVTAQPPKVG